MAQASPEALLVLRADGRIVAASPAVERLFGVERTALLGRHFGGLLPEGLPEAGPARRYAQSPGGASLRVELAVSTFTTAGETWRAVSVRDARAHEATETRLHERERQLERAVRLAHLATWRWDHATWRFEFSPEFCAMLGLSPEASCPTLAEALPRIHPDDRPAVVERMQADFATGSAFAFDMRLLRTDGTLVPVHCDGEVDVDSVGVPIGVFGVVQRVTGHELVQLVRRYFDLEAEVAERQLIEQALRSERDRAQSYLDVAGVMFIGLDVEGRVTLANARAAEILACPVDDILGNNWFDRFLPGALAASLRRAFHAMLAGAIEPFTHYENAVLRADGTERLIAWHNVILRDDAGRATGTLSSGEDITDRRQAELSLQRSMAEVQAVNRELESFAYTVSHDLRTPLRTIQGFSQILLADQHGSLDAEGIQLLHRIAHNAERLNELTEHLLALSRVGRAQVQIGGVDLAVVAREVIDMLAGAPGAARIEWVIPAALPARADPDMVRTLLQNLFDNACKFTRDVEAPRIELGREPDGPWFVRDNGVGFDMAFSDKLFRPFQRLHDRSFEGNGVGLATVARVVERHGGRVWGESRRGAGACFRFTLGD